MGTSGRDGPPLVPREFEDLFPPFVTTSQNRSEWPTETAYWAFADYVF